MSESDFWVAEANDPRLAPYRDLKERQLLAHGNRFVAESEVVVRQLLRSSLIVESVLVTAPRLRALQTDLAARPEVQIFRAEQSVIDAIAGFHVHRGCLALGVRPKPQPLPHKARLIIALEDLVNVDNVGAIVRHAVAFGADGLLLSPTCADPYYRKAIRVATGNTFALPIVRANSWPDDLLALRTSHAAELVAAVADNKAQPLQTSPRPRHRVAPGHVTKSPARTLTEHPLNQDSKEHAEELVEKRAENHPDGHASSQIPTTASRAAACVVLVFGSEGPGLRSETITQCDRRVTIEMTGADSLNVATACAVFLYHYTRT